MREVLIGQFEHTIDAKGRINFPAKFREDIGDRFILTKGLDNCIAVYSLEEWGRWEERFKSLPDSKSRQLKRFFFASATDVEPDKQGRIVLPSVLRDYAGLEKEVVVIGASDRAEIWDARRWAADNEDLTSDQMAELMDSLNF